ncbi:MAG: hypothetical protein COA79_20810 [Planctomycetota bacterium]|nr:MAG: hypothetical protein COA79_20810 [Planctomycetota bacterium]
MRILIVDDDKIVTDQFDFYLSKNHKITTFNSSMHALTYFKCNHNFDVIITDFLMPNLRGDELIDKILEIKTDQRFIVISGYFKSEFADTLKKYGADIRMIDKPVDLLDLECALDLIENKVPNCLTY